MSPATGEGQAGGSRGSHSASTQSTQSTPGTPYRISRCLKLVSTSGVARIPHAATSADARPSCEGERVLRLPFGSLCSLLPHLVLGQLCSSHRSLRVSQGSAMLWPMLWLWLSLCAGPALRALAEQEARAGARAELGDSFELFQPSRSISQFVPTAPPSPQPSPKLNQTTVTNEYHNLNHSNYPTITTHFATIQIITAPSGVTHDRATIQTKSSQATSNLIHARTNSSTLNYRKCPLHRIVKHLCH